MLTDLEIARSIQMRPISRVAADLGLHEEEVEPYGRHKAKIRLETLERLAGKPCGKYVVVTAITPTPLGEGKTVTSLGLGQGLAAIGKQVVTAIRQPSQGPTFGVKGGAAGGGYAQVVPMEDFNLHLTGDIHAVSAAHNLLAAALDARLLHESRLSDARLAKSKLRRLNIDPYSITWPRVLDINDRALRKILVGLGTEEDGRPRQTGFDISAASEVMAILALAADLKDLRVRLGRIVVGMNQDGKPVTADDLGAGGAMTVLMKEALQPNLLQNLEGGPVLVHAGPFANVAHGNSSIIADQIGLRLVPDGYLVTESGFGSECGMEKFVDIKCRYSGLKPDCAVVVASVRALKMHGGGPRVAPGKPLDKVYGQENLGLLQKGLANLEAHIGIVRRFGVQVVVAVNHFPSDTPAEIEMVRQAALKAGASEACLSMVWAKGGPGGSELAEAVVRACQKPSDFKFLYPLEASIQEKIEANAINLYGAERVEYSPVALEKIQLYTSLGFDRLPVNMAKTPLSLSHDANRKGAPRGFTFPVRDLRASIGAGFLYALCGEIQTMPGLPSHPAFMDMDLDEAGNIHGPF
ncbi:MAG: formate--tetrahydrofolate ligase [Candidatus Latescibacteria bacterium]|nr:formate--tetrahydrofolate ligase [Candidatus Latescibacterota bacterium]